VAGKFTDDWILIVKAKADQREKQNSSSVKSASNYLDTMVLQPSQLELIIECKADGSPPRSHIFLQARKVFQRPFDPTGPTDKVTSAIAYPVTIQPDDKGYRAPARGTTVFPFRFTLPEDVGSAIEVGNEVRTRYTLTGYARVRILGSFETLINSVEVMYSY